MKALAFSGGKDSMACLHLLRDELDCAIFVDSGFAYPETLALVDYAKTIVRTVIVRSDRAGQNKSEGVPADVVPIDWTRLGHALSGAKDVMVQSYLGCCYENLFVPLHAEAKRMGVTRLYIGQRSEEAHKSQLQSGAVVDGIERIYPIEDWTEAQVFSYLAEKMTVPAHYRIRHSSLDCYDCTAYREDSQDRVQWTKIKHPLFYAAYASRARALDDAVAQAMRGQQCLA